MKEEKSAFDLENCHQKLESKEAVSKSALSDEGMRDMKAQMLKVVKENPINNAGSFALTLLWQIFEAASNHFEEWGGIKKMNDDDIEIAFKTMFPNLIKNYPTQMELDT